MSCRLLNRRWLRALSLFICPLLSLQAAFAAQFGGGVTILVLEGSRNQNLIGEQAPKPISVRIVDRTGRPLLGASVQFVPPEGSVGGEFVTGPGAATVTADAQGVAVAPAFRAHATTGEYGIQILATYMGQTTRLLLPQSNVIKRKSSSTKFIIIGAVVGGAAAAAFAAKGGGGGGGGTPTPNSPPTGATSAPTITFLNTSIGAPQ